MANGKRNKKAEMEHTLVGLIILIIVIIFVVLPFFSRAYDRILGLSLSKSINSLNAVAIKLNNIYDEETIAVNLDLDHVIEGFSKSTLSGCGDGSCVCLCVNNCKNPANLVEHCKPIEHFTIKGNPQMLIKPVARKDNIFNKILRYNNAAKITMCKFERQEEKDAEKDSIIFKGCSDMALPDDAGGTENVPEDGTEEDSDPGDETDEGSNIPASGTNLEKLHMLVQNLPDPEGREWTEDDLKQIEDNLIALGNKYGVDPYYIALSIYIESGFDGESVNNHGCAGTIQFCPNTGQDVIGKDTAEITSINAAEQLKLGGIVDDYFAANDLGNYRSLADVYLTILYPAGRSYNHIEPIPVPGDQASVLYDDGQITKQSIEAGLQKNAESLIT